MRRPSLVFETFLSMLGASLLSVITVGIIARQTLSAAFHDYLSGLAGTPMRGRGMGRMVLGAAEETFLASIDRGVAIAAVAAVALAAVAALLLSRALTGSLERLTSGVRTLAGGSLDHRVEVSGPSEVATLGEAFNEMAEGLQTSETLRARMVADVAHELRNPVAALRAQAEGMAEGVLAADVPRLESLVEDVAHLSRLVDDLQELTLAEAGRLRYERTPFDIGALAEREVARAAEQAHVGVRVVCECEPIEVVADERRIAQVLRNLLSNALRHTRAGSVTVACAMEGDRVRLSVLDTGEGISAEDLPLIWERFYRADAARAKDTGGVGIGLAVSKRIVEDHGGEVFASSTPGSGSAIGFTLPLTG